MTESPRHRSGPDATPSPASDHTSLPLPLAGVAVVSLEHAVAAPFATRQLADLGARVIKIERPDGGDFARRYDESVHGQSSYFVWLNRSKHSLTLDVKSPDGRAVLEDLLAGADVLVQNLGPGAAARLLTALYRRATTGFISAVEVSLFEALLPPATLTHFDPAMNPVPAPGEHTEDTLRGLGRTDTAIAALRAKGVI